MFEIDYTDEGQVPLLAWTAMLTAQGATLAKLDSLPMDQRTTENALARVHWFVESPWRDLPQMLLHEEQAMRVLVQMLDWLVFQYRDQMSNR
ncbi:MAG: hypothetical protein OXG33_04220 [Chloroflexi bacterium]|nr:hypothetical protein [Chloroflexota bacterium]